MGSLYELCHKVNRAENLRSEFAEVRNVPHTTKGAHQTSSTGRLRIRETRCVGSLRLDGALESVQEYLRQDISL